MAQAPRTGASTRQAIADAATSFKVNGETYTFRLGDMTAKITKEAREVTGYTPMQILGMISGPEFTADLDVLAAFMWVCKHQAGETVDYDALLEEVNLEWLSTMEATEDHDAGDLDSPEV